MSQRALQLGFICRAAQPLKELCSFPRISIKQNLTQFEERYKVTLSCLSSLFEVHFYTQDQHLLVEENSIKCSLFPFSSFNNFFSAQIIHIYWEFWDGYYLLLTTRQGTKQRKKKITNKSHGPDTPGWAKGRGWLLRESSYEAHGGFLGWVCTAVRSLL